MGTPQHRPHLAPLVGTLSGLESLALKEWEYSLEDIPLITHLTRLQNLKVPHWSRKESRRQLCPNDLILSQWIQWIAFYCSVHVTVVLRVHVSCGLFSCGRGDWRSGTHRGEATNIHAFAQTLELSQVRPGNGKVEDEVWEASSLQFQDTFRALGQLTRLHLSNVASILVMDVLPAEDVGSLTNLRYISHSIERAFAHVGIHYSVRLARWISHNL